MAKKFDGWEGSLFLGEGSTVAQGDKCSGTNHILPTKKAGFISGGLNVHKFLKITTYQEISPEANRVISAAASRLSRVEGMEGPPEPAIGDSASSFQMKTGISRCMIRINISQQEENIHQEANELMNLKNYNHTVFTKEFTKQEAIPESGIARAVELMRSERLHRYNTASGELSEVALLEKEYAEYMDTKYCAALSSCGSSIYVALN